MLYTWNSYNIENQIYSNNNFKKNVSQSVQSFIHVQLFVTRGTAAHQASLSITNSRSLLKLMSMESVMPSNHLILCRPLLLLPSIFPSIRVFSNESVLCLRWPKYWSFSFSISPSNEYSGLISFRIDCFHFLAVQGTQESSPTAQFKSINSCALSFLYSSTVTSIHDYWKNHSFRTIGVDKGNWGGGWLRRWLPISWGSDYQSAVPRLATLAPPGNLWRM